MQTAWEQQRNAEYAKGRVWECGDVLPARCLATAFGGLEPFAGKCSGSATTVQFQARQGNGTERSSVRNDGCAGQGRLLHCCAWGGGVGDGWGAQRLFVAGGPAGLALSYRREAGAENFRQEGQNPDKADAAPFGSVPERTGCSGAVRRCWTYCFKAKYGRRA